MLLTQNFATAVTLLLFLVNPILGLLQDEIFKIDWQTTQIGVPTDAIIKDGVVITISDLNIFSILNNSDGNVLYRYQFEQNALNDSKLVEIWDGMFASGFNLENGGSKVTIWSIDESVGYIEKELNIDGSLIGLFRSQNENLLAIGKDGSIFLIGKDFSVSQFTDKSSDSFEKSKVLNTIEGDMVVFLENKKGSVFYKVLTNKVASDLNRFECSFDSMSVDADSVICKGSAVFKLENEKLRRVKTGKNLIVGGFSLDSLKSLDSSIIQHTVVDSQYLVAFTEQKAYLIDLDSESEVPLFSADHQIGFDDVSFYEVSLEDEIIEVFVVNSNYELQFFTNGELKWSRDESLAYIIDSAVVDQNEELRVSVDDILIETSSNLLTAYIDRLEHNFRLLFGDRLESTDTEKHFGFTKTLIVLTSNGKLFAFNTLKGDGDVSSLWKIDTRNSDFTKLYVVGNSVVVADKDSSLYRLNVENGSVEQLEDEQLKKDFKVIQGKEKIIQTEETDFYVLQSTEDGKSIESTHISEDEETVTWKYTVTDPENEKILLVTSRNYGNSKVANNAVVLGSRKVLYKFLAPNTAVFVVYNYQTMDLKIKLVNSITGQIYKTFISHTDNPDSVKVLFEENFIIVSSNELLQDDSSILAIDLFESLTPDVKKSSSSPQVSSLETDIVPESEVRSFILPSSLISSIAVTRTKYNITSKWIIFKLSSGEVIAVPRFMISGRRPLEVTKEQKEEFQLVKYDPVIPINPRMILSHHRKLLNGKNAGLASISTELESTSFVVSSDIDLFVTMVRPSGSFDSMTSDFNSKTLLLTIFALLLGIYAVKPMVTSKKLKDTWQIKI